MAGANDLGLRIAEQLKAHLCDHLTLVGSLDAIETARYMYAEVKLA